MASATSGEIVLVAIFCFFFSSCFSSRYARYTVLVTALSISPLYISFLRHSLLLLSLLLVVTARRGRRVCARRITSRFSRTTATDVVSDHTSTNRSTSDLSASVRLSSPSTTTMILATMFAPASPDLQSPRETVLWLGLSPIDGFVRCRFATGAEKEEKGSP